MRILIHLLISAAVCSAAVPAGAADAWRFAVISDTRGGEEGMNKDVLAPMARALARERIDLLVVVGDLVDGSSSSLTRKLEAWRKAMAPVYDAGIPVLAVRGNHEDVASPDAFRAAFPELPQNGPEDEKGLTWCAAHHNALFIGLDQYVREHQVNQEWLDRALAGNTRPHVFIFSHETAFAAEHEKTLAHYPVIRDMFWNSLGAAGVKLYFCGHDHFYARAAIPDKSGRIIQQVIIGSGGAPLGGFDDYDDEHVKPLYYDNDRHGYLVVEVNGDEVRVQWKARPRKDDAGVFVVQDKFAYAVPMLAASSQPAASQPAKVAVRQATPAESGAAVR